MGEQGISAGKAMGMGRAGSNVTRLMQGPDFATGRGLETTPRLSFSLDFYCEKTRVRCRVLSTQKEERRRDGSRRELVR